MDQVLLGALIDAIARDRGYDEVELATALGLAPRTIRSLSSRPVPAEHARQLCRDLGVDYAQVKVGVEG